MRLPPTMRLPIRASLSLAAAAACIVALSACVGAPSEPENDSHGTTRESGGVQNESGPTSSGDTGGMSHSGATLADDFPDVPLPDGELVHATRIDEGALIWGGLWVVDDPDVQFDALGARLVQAGFDEVQRSAAGEGILIGIYSNERYWITTGTVGEAHSLQVTVTQLEKTP